VAIACSIIAVTMSSTSHITSTDRPSTNALLITVSFPQISAPR